MYDTIHVFEQLLDYGNDIASCRPVINSDSATDLRSVCWSLWVNLHSLNDHLWCSRPQKSRLWPSKMPWVYLMLWEKSERWNFRKILRDRNFDPWKSWNNQAASCFFPVEIILGRHPNPWRRLASRATNWTGLCILVSEPHHGDGFQNIGFVTSGKMLLETSGVRVSWTQMWPDAPIMCHSGLFYSQSGSDMFRSYSGFSEVWCSIMLNPEISWNGSTPNTIIHF